MIPWHEVKLNGEVFYALLLPLLQRSLCIWVWLFTPSSETVQPQWASENRRYWPRKCHLALLLNCLALIKLNVPLAETLSSCTPYFKTDWSKAMVPAFQPPILFLAGELLGRTHCFKSSNYLVWRREAWGVTVFSSLWGQPWTSGHPILSKATKKAKT